jgi:UDP-N-acetylmuramyl pentapeptide synthase
MNNELKWIENNKAGQRVTGLVGRHPTEGSGFVAVCHFPFDGDHFPVVVAETGASAALVSDPPRAINSPSGLSLLQVQDTLSSLHQLAPSYRQLMPLRPVWN